MTSSPVGPNANPKAPAQARWPRGPQTRPLPFFEQRRTFPARGPERMQAAPARERAVLHYQRYGGFGLSYAWGRRGAIFAQPPARAPPRQTPEKSRRVLGLHMRKKNPAALRHNARTAIIFLPRPYRSLPSRSWAQYQGSGA